MNTINIKNLKDISWLVSEEVYRADRALSYSTLATYERGGFNELSNLFDKKETPSLTFGSAVDSIITGGKEEFDSKFIVAEFSSLSDTYILITKELFNKYGKTHHSINDIEDNLILELAISYNFQSNWKDITKVKIIKEKCGEYYNLLFLSGVKTILNTQTYNDVINSVRALKHSTSTKFYFADNSPFIPEIDRQYQLKFKAELNGIMYRCMVDLLIIDYNNKTIQPIDLKTSSHTEWDFYKSFIQWNYQIQARLYYRIILENIKNDDFFKDFTLLPYKFIIVNRKTLTPLVWDCDFTAATGDLVFGKNNQIVMRDPCTIGEELNYYLSTPSRQVPIGIERDGNNDLRTWLNKI